MENKQLLSKNRASLTTATELRESIKDRNIKKIISTLQGKLSSNDILDQNIHSLGIIRHGKTKNIDNEGDSQKNEETALDKSEFNKATSYIAMTAESIVDLWFKKITMYIPWDTLRNVQTAQLLKQYILELDPTIEITTDTSFENIALFHARKQFTADIYKALLSKPYLSPEEKETIKQRQGKKHVSWENRVIKDLLSDKTMNMIQEEDQVLWNTIKDKYEESYATIVDRAGKWVDSIRKHIAQYNDPETFHAIIAYRTTIQAADHVMKSNKEVQGTDNFFDIWFAQMQMSQCDQYGNSMNALTLNSYSYNEATYDEDVEMFHALQPEIVSSNDVYQNIGKINLFLAQTEWFLQTCLHGNNSNQKIRRRENLLERTMQQTIPPVMARRVLETVLNAYNPRYDKEGSGKAVIDRSIKAYRQQNPKQQDKLLELLVAYSTSNSMWKDIYEDMIKKDRSKAVEMARHNKHLWDWYNTFTVDDWTTWSFLTVDSGTLWSVAFDTLYIDQKLSYSESLWSKTIVWPETIVTNKDLLTLKNNVYVTASSGSGKSMLAKYLYVHHLRNEKSGKGIYMMHAGNVETIPRDRAKLVVIDGIDEMSIKQQQSLKNKMEKHWNAQCYCLSRTFPDNVWGNVSVYKLDTTLINWEEVVAHYETLLPEDQVYQYRKFMHAILPRLDSKDITYKIIDALGFISQTRSAWWLMKKPWLTRTEIYKLYMSTMADTSFERYKRLDPTVVENELLDVSYDVPRENLLQHIALHDWWDENDNDAWVIQWLYAPRDIDGILNEYFAHNPQWREPRIDDHMDYDTRNKTVLESLLVTGVLQKTIYNNSLYYRFPHKTILDYYRSLGIDSQNILQSDFYQACKKSLQYNAWDKGRSILE
jgi:hypothetical protein